MRISTLEPASLDRRRLIGLALACSASVYLPGRAWAQVEIISALQAAAEVAGYIKKIFTGWGSGSNVDPAALHLIDAKLDTIIQSQSAILSELADIKIAVKNILPQAYQDSLKSEQIQFRALIGEQYRKRQGDYDDLFHKLSDTCPKLGLGSFDVFTAFASGVAMLLTIAEVRRMSTKEVTQLRHALAPLVQAWLDPKNPDSVTSLVNRTAGQIGDGKARLAALPQAIHRANRGSQGPAQDCTWEEWIVISGGLDTPISGALERRNEQCESVGRNLNHGMGPLAEMKFVGGAGKAPAGPGVIPAPLFDNKAADAVKAAQDKLPASQGATAPYGEVNTVIADRNNTLSLMRSQIAYQALQASIQVAADALSA